MADTEETPTQRQARIRREKREAKIKGTAQERLDKITKLSGRTPDTMKDVSPLPTPPRTASPAVPTSIPQVTDTSNADQMRAQQDFVRNMLRAPPPEQGAEGAEAEDPMMKMLSAMLSGAGGMPGVGGDPNATEMPSLNPDDIAKATGLPPFLMNMFMGKQEIPATPAQQKEVQLWKLLHIIFALFAGTYMLFTLSNLTNTFGLKPPAPATFQNPFVVFLTGEGMLYGAQSALSRTPKIKGFGFWIQTAKDLARDAGVMVFMLGAYNWWHRPS